MQPIFESHPQVAGVSPGLRPIVRPPDVHPEPLVQNSSEADASGASIYGSVLREGGRFRMWYQAWPRRWEGGDAVTVGCLESEDGLCWRRPSYGLVECDGSRQNQLTDLPFHSPAVVLDPHAGPEARYRAFGFSGPRRLGTQFRHQLTGDGFYTAHSADGIHWELDSLAPVWPSADVITAVWDPWSDCARVVLKCNGQAGGMHRRCFHTATWTQGHASPSAAAFVPDELDDLHARERGFVTADYYGVALMPTCGPTIGFLWNFRHLPPLQHDARRLLDYANIGAVDLSLMVQPQRNGRWLHLPGRPDWLAAADAPAWARGALYTASSPVDVGDETWLYCTGTRSQHGWAGMGVDEDGFQEQLLTEGGFARIGLLRWPRHRLLGLRSQLPERLVLRPRPAVADEPAGLRLNVCTGPRGWARARLLDDRHEPLAGFGWAECRPLVGSYLEAPVCWGEQGALPAGRPGAPVLAEVELCDATLFAFDYVVA